ncbi:MAG: hypothetical protein ACFFKA_13895, partial [Candidatus Thorarchaeota archaeon]
EKDVKDKMYDFMMQNQGFAFTSQALMNRIDCITEDPTELNTSLKAIESDLYKMVWDGMLNVEYRNGEKYYILNPDFTVKMSEEPILVPTETDSDIENILYNIVARDGKKDTTPGSPAVVA